MFLSFCRLSVKFFMFLKNKKLSMVSVSQPPRMLALICATLLLSVKGSIADAGSLVGGRRWCLYDFCITLNEGEITAEAGLCAVIPCFFTLPVYFTFQSLVWFKCEPSKERCADSDIVLHTRNNRKVQSEFRGRVWLLEPDLYQNNCSIIVNDLTESDSGSYQLRVNKWNDGFTFVPRATVSVKGLSQRPTVMVPPLTAGQQATLTCIAPGLCSGSEPKITWMWRGAGENNSHITENITAFKKESLTPVTQRHSSTLTFNASAEHHGTKVTCKVSFINNISTEETVTLNVTLFPKILQNSECKVQLNVLTCVCVSQGFPSPSIKWPLLKNHTEYSVTTTLSNDTVTSTITLSVKSHSSTAVKCVSRNEVGEVQRTLNVITSEGQEGPVQQCSAVLPWAVAAVSLIVNVICIICLIFLWNTRKKVKPKQEDRTYMSLQKRDTSPEYDVVGNRKN